MTNKELQAQCAAMRSALEQLPQLYSEASENECLCAKQEFGCPYCSAWRKADRVAERALATDAGKGFVPADEHEEEKRRALIAGEDEADSDWLAAIQSKDWGGEISLAEGNEIASDGRNEIVASIHERFEALKKNTVPADQARVIALALVVLDKWIPIIGHSTDEDEIVRAVAVIEEAKKKGLEVVRKLGLLGDKP